jgi:hypothetical protein
MRQAEASATAAQPPSTTTTSRGPGRQRRPCLIICRTQSRLVLCLRRPPGCAGQHKAVRKGKAHTRWRQGNRAPAHHRAPCQAEAADDLLLAGAHRDRRPWP